MLQRLAQFGIALLEFFEQPHVLNRNDRLIGEGFEQRDLFVSKRSHLCAADQYSADGNTFTEQRRCEDGPNTVTSSKSRAQVVFRDAHEIMNMNSLAVNDGSARYGCSIKRRIRSGRQRPIVSHGLQRFALDTADRSIGCFTEPSSALSNSIQDRLHMSWR